MICNALRTQTESNTNRNLNYEYLLTYLLTYLRTYFLNPCSKVLLEKLTGSQLVKILTEFSGTRRFITAFITHHHLSLS